MAVAEKPHCGNCGVPFMYRTTCCLVTCSRMVSWMVLMAWLRRRQRMVDSSNWGRSGPFQAPAPPPQRPVPDAPGAALFLDRAGQPDT